MYVEQIAFDAVCWQDLRSTVISGRLPARQITHIGSFLRKGEKRISRLPALADNPHTKQKKVMQISLRTHKYEVMERSENCSKPFRLFLIELIFNNSWIKDQPEIGGWEYRERKDPGCLDFILWIWKSNLLFLA